MRILILLAALGLACSHPATLTHKDPNGGHEAIHQATQRTPKAAHPTNGPRIPKENPISPM